MKVGPLPALPETPILWTLGPSAQLCAKFTAPFLSNTGLPSSFSTAQAGPAPVVTQGSTRAPAYPAWSPPEVSLRSAQCRVLSQLHTSVFP